MPAAGSVPYASPNASPPETIDFVVTAKPAPCSTAVASAFDFPRTVGTATITGPLETTRAIASPFLPLPLFGVCDMTSPAATVLEFCWVAVTVKPAAWSSLVAWSAGLPS